MAEPAYRINVEDGDVVVRLKKGFVDSEQVSKFLDYLTLESLGHRSRLSEADATALADEIDRAVWERTRSHAEG
jgi:hypothetical protein